MASLVSLAVRTIHVLAITVVVGSTVALWYGYRSGGTAALTVARQYEWFFWGALGAVALTGVGNLGALGPPGPATDWGRLLLVKLGVVLALAVGSAVRTLVVVRAADGGGKGSVTPGLRGTLERAYGLTAGTLVVLVVLAEVLAHG
ncbi:CopD family protein [Haloarcula onubensis]|uniref:CopD family protein n=1 Tax=Haloarcula onubensis TaxID=2950539 RepID=A0ABU2FKX8_9EURY|nr:CopD family protein [Halomicroarcula sp. S3CR25-11]MDS0280912.1 CopD family protein [Halomicroarcula sp. S3CR25-11]